MKVPQHAEVVVSLTGQPPATYIREGKSYLTIAFGCTGGQHRSVMMASEICRQLVKAGHKVKESHRDMPRT